MPSILLTSVFGPFGVDDEYGRKENPVELFHNQVTREQGAFSMRFFHPSFGLYFLAENVNADVTVMDFPSESRFVREIQKGYDYVGISFIIVNTVKAGRMAQLVRRLAPATKIILGGHGTSTPGVEDLVEHDHICRGEGIRWLRELLGEDPGLPIRHPVIPSGIRKSVLGVPLPVDNALLCPGVGCPNACRFCATSHFFGRRYQAFLETGDELYRACCEIEAKLGVREFFVMDENFLKQRKRAERFLELVERDGKEYTFGIFSSADAIREVGVDFLVRLGVYLLWVGVESKYEIYEKNRGIDFPALIKECRDAGVAVLASGILFVEQHDRKTIEEDIDFLVSLNADFVQFMELGPIPGTALWDDYKDKNKLVPEMPPWEECHGQDKIWFKHPSFERDETAVILKKAFERDFQVNGPSVLRILETAARGARNLPESTELLRRRRRQYLARCRQYRPLLRSIRLLSPSKRMREHARSVERLYKEVLGRETVGEWLRSLLAFPGALAECVRVKLGRTRYQPPTLVSHYPASKAGGRTARKVASALCR